MLFDSPEILAVCKKYAQAAIYEIPSIVRLATDEKYEGERQYLAALYNDMPSLKRKTWFHRFTSDNRDQFWGAWFELMLFGWLKPYLGEKIVHTTVSGTLVFLQKYDEKNKKRDFDVHWIENPFADDNVKLDPNLFPVDNSFVVKDRGVDYVNMHWLRDV